MTRRQQTTGIAAVSMVVWAIACGGGSPSQPTAGTAAPATAVSSPTTSSPSTLVDAVLGDWQADALTDPAALAAAAAAEGSCSQVEFRVARDAGSETAAVVFAAACGQARVRAEGKGTMAGDALLWRAEGQAALPGGRTCVAAFGDGSKARPAGEGAIAVAYNGRICDRPVSGTVLVRRK